MVPQNELKWDWPRRPTKERDFAEMMLSLDECLARSGYEPHHRDWTATDVVQQVFRFQAATHGPLVRMMGPATPWDGRDLLERIERWYKSTYGRRRYSAGYMFAACALRSTIWRLDIPEIHGTVQLVADTNLALGAGHEPVWNVLNSVEGAGPEIMLGLSWDEQCYLLELAQLSETALMTFRAVHASPLRQEAIGDYILSVQALVAGTSYNSARWLNAQCAEKLIKTVLAGLNVDYKGLRPVHSIPKYCQLLAEHDPSFELPASHQEQIDCTAGVRYGEEGETQPLDALASHHALLHLLIALGRRGKPAGRSTEGWRRVE